ncbi:MAG: hypothetical protein ACI4DK_07215 [Lachnospiraceae bacterium]
MNENLQNACLMTTCINEETGKTELTYIPLAIDISIVEFFLENGTCTNNLAVSFELETDGKQFWKEMWEELEKSCE